MNFPAIPTDNLYKFTALFGLVITILSAYVPYSKVGPLELHSVRLATDIAALQATADGLKEEVRLYNEAQRIGPKALRAIGMTGADTKAMRLRLVDITVKNAEIRGLIEQQLVLASELRLVAFFGVVGMLVGTLIVGAGFYFWFSRVQRFQDIVLNYEARRAQ